MSTVPEVIPMWLRDLFGRIEQDYVYEYRGTLNENDDSRDVKNLFMSANNIFPYLSKNKIFAGIITIIIPNLRDLYWNKRNLLTSEEIIKLSSRMNEPLTKLEYIGLGQFRLKGNVTPYDVLHIPVDYFIQSLNEKISIEIVLNKMNTIIRLDYSPHDFWDFETQQLINNIP